MAGRLPMIGPANPVTSLNKTSCGMGGSNRERRLYVSYSPTPSHFQHLRTVADLKAMNLRHALSLVAGSLINASGEYKAHTAGPIPEMPATCLT